MKLRVRRRVGRAIVWGAVAAGALIAGGAIFISLTRGWSLRIDRTVLLSFGALVMLSLVCSLARRRLRGSVEIAGVALVLLLARYGLSVAFLVAGGIVLPTAVAALISGAASTSALFQAFLLTTACSIVTTLSLGSALDLKLLLGPKPGQPAER